MGKLQKQHQEYQWIADRFSKIQGADVILINSQDHGAEVNMMITNNRPGKGNKIFTFPLKTTFYVDYQMAPEACPNPWDINLFPDPEMIVNLGIAKAKQIFERM